jgi:transposase
LHGAWRSVDPPTVTVDWRDERIRELEEENARLRAHVDALERPIQELEATLARFSGNSSKPPSSDPPGAPPPSPPKRKGKQRGGQPGHERHTRTLVPPEKVTRFHTVKPCTCRECGEPLEGEDAHPLRHQVTEIPKIEPIVDEYQLHSLVCDHCGTATRAALPDGVPTGHFGPRLQALVAVSSGDYQMSKRKIENMLEDFFGVEIALGTVANLEQTTSEAIAAPVEEVAQAIQKEPIVHADETGWYERSKRAWLWVAVTAALALFLIRKSRGAEVAKELLGAAFGGILVSDRWSAYAWVDVARRQLCWAHLLRQFRGFQEYREAAAIGRGLELLTEVMFHHWHRVREGTLTRAAFEELMEPLKQHVVAWLQEGTSCGVPKVAGRCYEILALSPALWTFVHEEGVEPTNNAGERIVRAGVLWRKRSFGTDSPNGSRFVERIMTVVATLRLQKRNVLDYVTAACEAALHGRPAPSLLPT